MSFSGKELAAIPRKELRRLVEGNEANSTNGIVYRRELERQIANDRFWIGTVISAITLVAALIAAWGVLKA